MTRIALALLALLALPTTAFADPPADLDLPSRVNNELEWTIDPIEFEPLAVDRITCMRDVLQAFIGNEAWVCLRSDGEAAFGGALLEVTEDLTLRYLTAEDERIGTSARGRRPRSDRKAWSAPHPPASGSSSVTARAGLRRTPRLPVRRP